MKKLLSLIMVAMIAFSSAGQVFAASETVSITITINHNLNIEVGGSANLSIVPGTTAVSAAAITVKNVSTGVAETITLAATAPNGWTPTFQFAAAKPAADSTAWKAAGDISEALAHDATKKLWLKLVAPAATSETSANISLTVTAS